MTEQRGIVHLKKNLYLGDGKCPLNKLGGKEENIFEIELPWKHSYGGILSHSRHVNI